MKGLPQLQLTLYRDFGSPLEPWPGRSVSRCPGAWRATLGLLVITPSAFTYKGPMGPFAFNRELKTPGPVAISLRPQENVMFSEARPPWRCQPNTPLTLFFKAQNPLS